MKLLRKVLEEAKRVENERHQNYLKYKKQEAEINRLIHEAGLEDAWIIFSIDGIEYSLVSHGDHLGLTKRILLENGKYSDDSVSLRQQARVYQMLLEEEQKF